MNGLRDFNELRSLVNRGALQIGELGQNLLSLRHRAATLNSRVYSGWRPYFFKLLKANEAAPNYGVVIDPAIQDRFTETIISCHEIFLTNRNPVVLYISREALLSFLESTFHATYDLLVSMQVER